jgi:DNA-binding transcriptional MerR regulator
MFQTKMLTRLQIQENIDALEEQGASPDEIQEWLDSLPKQFSQASTEAPKKEGIFKKIGKAIISSELKFGKSIADAMPSFVPGSAAWTNKQNEQIMANQHAMMENLLVQRKKLKAEGKDTSRLDAAIQDMQEQMSKPAIDINETNASVNKTGKQIFGEGLGVAADILSAGSYGKAAQGAQSGKLLIAGKASGKVATVLGKAGIGSTVSPAAGALPSIIGGGTKAQAALKGAWQGAKQGLVSGSVWGTAQGATRAMQENKSNTDIASDAITGGVVGGVAGGTLGAIVGGTSGYINRRRELNRLLKPAMTPDETINSLHDEIAKHADEDAFKASIKSGDLNIDQVYQKDGSLNPELAKGRIDDIAANLDLKVPGAGEKYRTLIDPNKTTFDELISKADDVIDESRKIPADAIQYSVTAEGKKIVDKKASEALKAGIADQDIAFMKNASVEDKKIFEKAMKVAEQASKDKTYSRQPIEQAGKVLIEQADTVEGARQKVGHELGTLRAKLGDTPVAVTDTADIFYKDLDDAGITITKEGLDFSKSKYANVPKIQKILESVHQRIGGLGEQSNVKTVDMIRQQLGTEVDLGTLEGNLDKSAKRILQKVYAGLGDNIAYIDTDYAELSNEYSKLTSAMDYFQRVLGKDFEATNINSSLRAGEVGRRILGNASSRPLAIVENIQDLARAYGYNKNVDARSQFLFASFLEDLFGTTQTQSLQHQITKGVNNAEEAVGAVTDVATGNASGLLSKAVRKGINLVRNITPERQIEAVRALITP